MLSRLLGRCGRLVLDHIVEGLGVHNSTGGIGTRGRSCRDPVAELGPLGGIPRRRVRIGESNDQAGLGGRAKRVDNCEGGCMLEIAWVEGVAKLSCVVR